MPRRSSFHRNSRTETFASLINCVINDALLGTMLDIYQALLQFFDVMNLLDLLLHFAYIFSVNRVSRNIALLEDKELATDLTHDKQ